MKPEADYVFEASWEVCNKVGGIYTVIKSKASRMMELYKNYILIGPYFEHNARIDFVQMDPPSEFAEIFNSLKNEGIMCHFGKWLEVKGKPFTILIDFGGIIGKKDGIKKLFWEEYHIDSLRGYWDFEEPMLWSYAVGKLLERIRGIIGDKKIVGHFHEWLSAFALLYLKKNCRDFATVFTTHATILGRTLASHGVDLYGLMDSIDPLHEAYNNNIEAKFLTEKAATLNADTFTTVSEVIGIEAEKFLGRKPEVLVINGLDIEKFLSFEELSIKHITSRDKIREFLTYYFFPYYRFEVNQSLLFFTVGRFEHRNKGYDILIRVLGVLNEMLKKDKSDVTISVLFWIPMQNYGLRLEVLENKNYYMHIKNYVESNNPEILKKIIYDFICKKEKVEQLFTESFLLEIKKDLVVFERKGNPPLSTHNIDEYNNPIIRSFLANNLLNKQEDRVKVILEPVYLDGTDGFIDIAYYDAMVGCHLGIFPSYYEPYGYTPLESAALAVPAITTDMSGFGKFIMSKNPENKGIYVLRRFARTDDSIIQEFADMLYTFAKQTHPERVNCKLRAKTLSMYADWKILVENYVRAHNLALANNANSQNNPLSKAK